MDMPEGRDLVIGLPYFPKFGFKAEGIPVKKPGTAQVEQLGEKKEPEVKKPVMGLPVLTKPW